MIGWLGGTYLWVKAAHLIVVIFWMASLFILPRYLVHLHGEADRAETWGDRIAKLRKVIMTPAMLAVWALGIALTVHIGMIGNGWLGPKILLVLALTGYHGWMVGLSKKMLSGARPLSERALRLANEVPGVATIAIVILAIVKPF
ncbi:MAG: CopD family protein [Pacificimonas sp.]